MKFCSLLFQIHIFLLDCNELHLKFTTHFKGDLTRNILNSILNVAFYPVNLNLLLSMTNYNERFLFIFHVYILELHSIIMGKALQKQTIFLKTMVYKFVFINHIYG